MKYQNQDLAVDKFFVDSTTDEIVDVQTALLRNLRKEIYFSPSCWPLISNSDTNKGTAWQDLICPTASWIYHDTDSEPTLVDTDLSLENYREILYSGINQNIKKIYQKHPTALLFYSGGIDSMVCLASIIHQGFLDRTTIVTFENLTQSHDSCLHQNYHKKFAVIELIDRLSGKFKDHIWQKIELLDVAQAFNHGKSADLRCYATSTMLQKFKDSAMIYGHHGNQTLLHKWVFIDEILLSRPHLINSIPGDDCYTPGLKKFYSQRNEFVPLHRCHMLMKPWPLLDQKNGNSIYSPLGDHQILTSLRRINFNSVDIATIADAKIARRFIDTYAPGIFEGLIISESLKDYDNLENMEIPRQWLDQNLLCAPENLRHHPEGLDWIQWELARHTDVLPINTLVSIKNLHHMAAL